MPKDFFLLEISTATPASACSERIPLHKKVLVEYLGKVLVGGMPKKIRLEKSAVQREFLIEPHKKSLDTSQKNGLLEDWHKRTPRKISHMTIPAEGLSSRNFVDGE